MNLPEKECEKIYNNLLKSVIKETGFKGTTNSLELDRMGKLMFGNEWGGVFSSDTIPRKGKLKKYSITNNKPSTHMGEHWVGIVNEPSLKQYIIYDSFGRQTRRLLPTFYKKNKGKIIDTDYDKEQKKRERNCGARVLTWILFYKMYGRKNALKI